MSRKESAEDQTHFLLAGSFPRNSASYCIPKALIAVNTTALGTSATCALVVPMAIASDNSPEVFFQKEELVVTLCLHS